MDCFSSRLLLGSAWDLLQKPPSCICWSSWSSISVPCVVFRETVLGWLQALASTSSVTCMPDENFSFHVYNKNNIYLLGKSLWRLNYVRLDEIAFIDMPNTKPMLCSIATTWFWLWRLTWVQLGGVRRTKNDLDLGMHLLTSTVYYQQPGMTGSVIVLVPREAQGLVETELEKNRATAWTPAQWL